MHVTEEVFLGHCWPLLKGLFSQTLLLAPGEPFAVPLRQADVYTYALFSLGEARLRGAEGKGARGAVRV